MLGIDLFEYICLGRNRVLLAQWKFKLLRQMLFLSNLYYLLRY